MTTETNTILLINSSVQGENSSTRKLTGQLVEKLQDEGNTHVIDRDLGLGIPFINEDWVKANFTPVEDRTNDQKEALAFSDSLVEEIKTANTLVIGLPVYNFSLPAALKGWIDQTARARLTFRYTDNGPVGLMTGKKAYVVVASGGTKVGSDIDFATPYLKHALAFMGITDVTIIDGSAGGVETAELAIAEL